MHRLAIAGFLAALSVSGCAWMKGTAASEGRSDAQVPVPPTSAPQTTPPPASTPPTPVAAPPSPASTLPTEAGSSTDNGSERSSTPARASDAAAPPPPPTTPPPPVNPASRSSSAKARSSGDTRPAKVAGAAAAQTRQPGSSPAPLPPSSSAPAPASTPNASPTLNLADLEQRLRETRAIGVFTKLSLKNQVDDLLNAFRELYRGPDKHPSAELRQRYDLLLLKVLTLLQDGDPPLAAAISSSREAIWGILADPDKFAKI
jgi:hypothetical protein